MEEFGPVHAIRKADPSASQRVRAAGTSGPNPPTAALSEIGNNPAG